MQAERERRRQFCEPTDSSKLLFCRLRVRSRRPFSGLRARGSEILQAEGDAKALSKSSRRRLRPSRRL